MNCFIFEEIKKMNIIITGASRGIGFELVKKFAVDSSNTVFTIARSKAKLDKLHNEIIAQNSQANIFSKVFDLLDGKIQDELLPFIFEKVKTVDILVNNAGLMINKAFSELTDEDFDNTFAVNVKSVFRLTRDLLPYFSSNAHIVNITSMGGVQGSAKFPGLSIYSSSKGALGILTECLAEELKEKGHADAKLFDEVTVLFTDFKGFTQMAEKLSAQELVNEIDFCFKKFDEITSKYNIEKIKTIGDAYMCAAGLHVQKKAATFDMIHAAFEIQQFMVELKEMKMKENKPYFELRLGIHTGPVVAGIVGIKKFQYDIWGDTVNIAARMESSGEIGKVNISQYTYEIIKDQFNCVHRGKIEAKGKGEIDMYFVEPV